MKSIPYSNRFLVAFCIYFITSNTLLLAQNTIDLDTTKIHSIERVTLRKTQNRDSKIKDLTLRDTDRLTHDAGRFLTQLPEISGIRKAGQYGMDPVLRGFKYEQLNIVIDGGLSALNACPSRMDPPSSQINMNMVQEAQIYKGPYHFRYGPALGGSINFVTLAPSFKDSIALSGRFSSGYESNGSLFKSEASVSLQSKKLVSNLFAGYQTADSYQDGNDAEVPSSFTRYNVGSKSTLRWNEHQQTTLQLTTNQARNVEFAALSMDLLYDKTWMSQLEHKIHFDQKLLKVLDFSGYGSWVDHSMGTYDHSMVSKVFAKTYGARTEATFQTENSKFFTGMDFKFQSAENKEMTMPMMGHSMQRDGTSWQDSTLDQWGWFNEFQTRWENSKLTLSYRMDYDQGQAKELSELFIALYGDGKSDNLNHSFSVGYTRALSPALSLALWSGRAERSASLSERYINRFPQGLDNYEMLGNPKLKPESNFQTDLILSYQNKAFSIQASGFYSYLTDFISGKINLDVPKSSMRSPGVRQYVNLDRAFKTGFELVAKYHLNSHFHSSFGLAYTYAENLATKIPLAEISPLDLRLNVTANFYPLELGANLRHTGAQNRIDPSFSELKTPSFTLLDLDFKYAIFKSTSIFASVSNVFNVAYAEHLSRTLSSDSNQRILAPGRSLGVGFTTNF
ncbi:TonB-dependent receptor domain-containing protein [Chryseobacterium sp. A321]